MKMLPEARNTNIVVQSVGNETLIYDLLTNKAYNLNETSSIIFNACDGKTSFEDLRKNYQYTDDLIFLALDELQRENLIETNEASISPFAGMSRREAIKKVGLGSMIALPLIVSIVAPTAANAQSSSVCQINDGGACSCTFTDGIQPSCISPDCAPNCSCNVFGFTCSPNDDGSVLCDGFCDNGRPPE